MTDDQPLDKRVHNLQGVEWLSGVSAREGYPPFVTLRVTSADGHTIVGQMEIDQAREIAVNALGVLEAADMDSAVLRFFMQSLEVPEETALEMVAHLRNFRQSQR